MRKAVNIVSKTSGLNAFQVAATYIGTIVGAGFASGQEVLQYFSAYGIHGIWAILLTSLLLFLFGFVVLAVGKAVQARSYVNVVQFTNGKLLGAVIDLVITIFLFGALAIMFAGAGAIFDEQFHLSPLWGTLVMAVLSLLTVFTGIKGVIHAISYLVPLLLIAVLGIAIYSIFTSPITSDDLAYVKSLEGVAPNWLVSSFNYASYNLVMALPVLAPMGAEATRRKTLFWGAFLGGVGLGVGILAIYLSILTNIEVVGQVEIPMIRIALNIAPVIQILFVFVLLAAIYTTAIGNLYGFVSRITIVPVQYQKWVIVITTIGAFCVSQVGFRVMVKYLYSAVGYVGFLFFAGLLYVWFFKRKEIQ